MKFIQSWQEGQSISSFIIYNFTRKPYYIGFLIPTPFWKRGMGCFLGCGDPLDCSVQRWRMAFGLKIYMPDWTYYHWKSMKRDKYLWKNPHK